MKKVNLLKMILKNQFQFSKRNLGKVLFFSYPFGEYSIEFKNIIKALNFKYAFGQHSGVMDETKDFYELQDILLMKNTEIKRFNSLMKTLPLNIKIFFQKKISFAK